MSESLYRILSLDGGGSLGVYTLGILCELERTQAEPLHDTFDLVYGTSTGSIIGSMIALGEKAETVKGRYFEIVPKVMSRRSARAKSAALEEWAFRIYGDRKFDSFKTGIGIVATQLEYNRPMIFKNEIDRAHQGKGSFEPGFGCTIREAVVASCAAVPFFSKRTVSAQVSGQRTLVDGGFCANNPSLFALTDVTRALGLNRDRIRLLNLGTGTYPVRRRLGMTLLKSAIPTFTTLLSTSSNTVEELRELLYPDILSLRINDANVEPSYTTDFLEKDSGKLEKIFQLGRDSFRRQEIEIRRLLDMSNCV